MRKILFAASVAALAIGAPLAAAAPALADSQPLITVGESTCVAPWYWEGPLNIGSGAEPYSACNGSTMPAHQGKLLGVLDNSCLLPWHWQGPGNILTNLLTGGQVTGDYSACDSGPMPTPVMPPPVQGGMPTPPCPPAGAPAALPAPGAAAAPAAMLGHVLSSLTSTSAL